MARPALIKRRPLGRDTVANVYIRIGVPTQRYPAVIERELRRYLPFLATTKVLLAAVAQGVGREQAHEAIKTHAVALALSMREQGAAQNDLVDRLAGDDRLGLSREQLTALLQDPTEFVGTASAQTSQLVQQLEAITRQYPEATQYEPEPML